MSNTTINTSLLKSLKLILLTPALFFSPYNNATLNATVLKDGRVFVTGTLDDPAMQRVQGHYYPEHMRLDLEEDSYSSEPRMHCYYNKDKTIESLNNTFSNGIYLSDRRKFKNNSRYIFIFCNIDDYDHQLISWQIHESVTGTNIPTSSYCSVTTSNNIDFGTINMGNSGVQKKTDVSFVCSKDASITLKAAGAINGIIRIGDAGIQPQFSNGRSEITFNTDSRLATVPLTLTVQDTGAVIGKKSGSMILTAEWN